MNTLSFRYVCIQHTASYPSVLHRGFVSGIGLRGLSQTFVQAPWPYNSCNVHTWRLVTTWRISSSEAWRLLGTQLQWPPNPFKADLGEALPLVTKSAHKTTVLPFEGMSKWIFSFTPWIFLRIYFIHMFKYVLVYSCIYVCMLWCMCETESVVCRNQILPDSCGCRGSNSCQVGRTVTHHGSSTVPL